MQQQAGPGHSWRNDGTGAQGVAPALAVVEPGLVATTAAAAGRYTLWITYAAASRARARLAQRWHRCTKSGACTNCSSTFLVSAAGGSCAGATSRPVAISVQAFKEWRLHQVQYTLPGFNSRQKVHRQQQAGPGHVWRSKERSVQGMAPASAAVAPGLAAAAGSSKQGQAPAKRKRLGGVTASAVGSSVWPCCGGSCEWQATASRARHDHGAGVQGVVPAPAAV